MLLVNADLWPGTSAYERRRTLAENSGLQASDVVSSLYAAHAGGDANAGVDIEGGAPKDLTGARARGFRVFSRC